MVCELYLNKTDIKSKILSKKIDRKNVSLCNDLHLTGWKMIWKDGLFWIRGSGGASLR